MGVALVVALVVVGVLEVVGVVRARRGHTDTISELYWWVVAHVNPSVRWAINVGLIAALVWTAVHLICHCGI